MSQVAQTILQQLGGRRFIAMTGAKNFVGGEDRLQFSIPTTKYKGKKVNKVVITLNDSDLYTTQYGYLDRKTFEFQETGKSEHLYHDQLPGDFRLHTGLDTYL